MNIQSEQINITSKMMQAIDEDDGEYCPECCSEILNGQCDCPPPVLEIKEVSVTYNVKVKIHSDARYGYSTHPTIEDAIKAWHFGEEKWGAHHWDKEYCHVAPIEKSEGYENPEDKWALLYL